MKNNEKPDIFTATFTAGEHNLKDLTYDTAYTLHEVSPPAGYVIKENDATFKITMNDSGEIEVVLTGAQTSNQMDGNVIVISIENELGAELPMTGGSGTLPYTLGGITVMLTALMYGFRMRRGERRLN